jgi:beta-glucosidase
LPSIEKRATELVSRMTLAEKVSQMGSDAPAIERLDIPAYNWWNECLHGLGRAGLATVFPQAIGLAATWNPFLVHEIATAISDEARAKHHEARRLGVHRHYSGLTEWTPNVNIFRDPRWGRGQETYGEDPILTARLGVAFVRGLQGDNPDYLKVIATPKHFAVHSGPESSRHSFDVRVGQRDLHDTYLPAFQACVRAGRAASVMGAYNRVNGEPCCASPTLLGDILRGEWGFDGYVVSDCGAIFDIHASHQVVTTAAEAAALAVGHGCDLDCGTVYPAALLAAVEQGLVAPAAIDRAVERLFAARFRLGMFDPPEQVPYAQIPYEVVDSPEHRALALQAARESIVLLKNDGGLLPLPRDLEAVAVVGPNADEITALLGNYHGTPAQVTTPLAGIRQKASPGTAVYHAPGCTWADGLLPLVPIPPACLRPAGGGEGGLAAEYYDNSRLEGEAALTRVDRLVDFTWNDTSPLTGRWGDPFSVRWIGSFIPPASGAHRLGVNGHSGYRLYLDGELVLEAECIHHPFLTTRDVDLEAGRLYHLCLEHFSEGLDPQVQLLWAPPGGDAVAQALAVASQAEVVVAIMGLSPRLEGEEMPVDLAGFAGGDRTDLALPPPQEALLQALAALGKPLVLVLLNGSALAVNWAADHVPAIVEAWYPGQAGGEALAEVLFGEFNPGGRLPVTFYRSVADLPPFDDYGMEGRTYRYFRGEALFPFGHGLSYTTFAYDSLQIAPGRVPLGGEATVRAVVTNTGDRTGDEVVQLYVRRHEAAGAGPIRELKDFSRIGLQPGESRTVTFTLNVDELGTYDQDGRYRCRPGTVQIMLGSSSQELHLRGHLEIVAHRPG